MFATSYPHIIKKRISIGFAGFWRGFSLSTFIARHPYLLDKYQFIEAKNPEFQFISVFQPPSDLEGLSKKACKIFYTGENIQPDMAVYDFGISFSHVKGANHFRLPCWVPRLYENGMHPKSLLNQSRAKTHHREIAPDFCNFIYRKKIALREEFFSLLDSTKHVSSAGQSCNNSQQIGHSVEEKINYQKKFRFAIAFENEIFAGYITEKIIEAYISGNIPIYMGDPSICEDFNPSSFIRVENIDGFLPSIERILTLENTEKEFLEMRNATIFKNNCLPAYAQEDNIMTFFEGIFD